KMVSKELWKVLALLRVLSCLFPQPGYIHPDEFFQSPEVMAGDILDLQVHCTWEYNSSTPARTPVFPLLTTGLTFWVLRSLDRLGLVNNIINSYTLLVAPRLCFTLLSFIMDYALYHLALSWGADQWNTLVLFAGSYVTLVIFTRTFSNVLEGIFFALLLLAVTPTPDNRVAEESKHGRRARRNTLIGVLTVAGFFNRPSFVGFAFMPVIYWTALDENGGFRFKVGRVIKNSLKMLPAAIATVTFFIVADTMYFRHALSQNIVVTPYNLMIYNLDSAKLEKHGFHPRITHLSVNSTMLFGILHLLAFITSIRTIKGIIDQKVGCREPSKTNSQSKSSLPQSTLLLLMFYFVPLFHLSFINHQEARYIAPVILPLVLLSASENKKLRWKPIIVLFNILGALLFGWLHQGGIIPCLSHLERVIHSEGPVSSQSQHTVLFYHTYMPPRHLLHIGKENDLVKIIDLYGAEKQALCQTVQELVFQHPLEKNDIEKEKPCHFYIVAPGTVRGAVQECGFLFTNITSIFPHLTMEDPPNISALLSGDGMFQLGLDIFKLDTRK
uniref:Mannosyltransferase n=1 Tax=Latimeria chalumnae TaxID=7897 RepID=H3BD85_LATCH